MRRALSLLLRLAISALLLTWALSGVDLGAVADRLSELDPRWIGLGLLMPLAQTVLLALRWRTILGQCGADLPLGQALRYCMIAMFFNQTLPSSVGGDAMRIWLAGKQSDWRTAAYSVLIDRVVGVTALAIVVTACLPWTFALVRNPIGRGALLLIGLGCIAAGAAFVALAWQRLSILQSWTPTRHLAAAAAVAFGIVRAPPVLLRLYGLSFVIHLLTGALAWCAARSVGVDLPLAYAIFLVLPVILIAVVPVSIAGWGLREGAMVAAFDYAGLAPGVGLIVSLLYGAIYLAVGVVGGLIWVATAKKTGRAIASSLASRE
jgi:uncharacterized membrane protein YbhN (UPF0104 family)